MVTVTLPPDYKPKAKEEFMNEKLCEIYNKMNTLQSDISYMKEDIHDIKLKVTR